jgi:hypothetical protein
MEVRVTRDEITGDVEVWQDGKTSKSLTPGEMIELVLKLVYPEGAPQPRYAMLTPEEWDARERDSRRRRAAVLLAGGTIP